jgi:uncharacterized LabA/DUF88 family protein
LHNYICAEISARLDIDAGNCNITEAHYFRGRLLKAGNEKAILGERYFEDALTREGVDLHYLPLVRGINNEMKEKGIDVSLALDAYKKAAAKAIDILALIAGDGDYLPLVRELKAVNGTSIDVMLLSWDFENANGETTMTSQDLLEEVKYPIQMANVIDDRLNIRNPMVMGLFESRQVEAAGLLPYGLPPGQTSTLQPSFPPQEFNTSQGPRTTTNTKRKLLTEAEMAQERISTILSLDISGGWIRDMEYNNFYFFNTDIVNKKAEELAVGMTLQFRLKFDKVKTEQKDNGEPSYRATGPIYVVD